MVVLTVAAALTFVAWLALVAVLAVVTRPRVPEPAPADMALAGDESPAVANLLTGGWELGHEAVPATLLDLAARKYVAIDQVSPERFVCRVLRKSDDVSTLLPYERQVLDHVRRLARDGVVPCEALSTGPEEAAKGWWKRFAKAVVADARRRGLSRARWSPAMLTLISVAAVAPAVLAGIATKTVGVALAGWFAMSAAPTALRAERETPDGQRAAAGWLGLQAYLRENPNFPDQPPAAVILWDRYLAYGAALGVAATAVRALPLGSQSPYEAWTAFGGHWHVVRIRYPKHLPPGWGRAPVIAAAIGGFWTIASGLFAMTIGRGIVGAMPGVGELRDGLKDAGEAWSIVAFGIAVVTLMAVMIFGTLLRSVVMLAFAVSDLFTQRSVVGQVLRVRHDEKVTWIAVHDGTGDRVRAWIVAPALLTGVSEGDVVRVTVTPRLGYVSNIDHDSVPPPHAVR